ncbi:MAG: hypothetical protein GF364_17985 [Candidatus Lokiarchaeota archaeon]|nr:hypothetical protein [Candidatus Lokiarchaeota archaeon]
MVLNNFRHVIKKYIDKPIDWFIAHNVSPNTLSFIGFSISVLAAIGYALPEIFIYRWYLAWVPVILFFISGFFDVLDGGVARKSGQTSKFGGFLDSTLDRLGDGVVIFGLTYGGMFWRWDENINNTLGFIIFGIMVLISYTRSRAENEGVFMQGIGIMERAERMFIIMGAYIIESSLKTSELFKFNLYPDGTYHYRFFPVFSLVFLALCIQTLVARVLHTYRWLSGKCSDKYLEKYDLIEKYEAYKKTTREQNSKEKNQKSSKIKK